MHIRLYQGGHLDGRQEMLNKNKLRPFINKSEWRGEQLVNNHYYVLAEPMKKKAADEGATYIYEYRPSWRPGDHNETRRLW